MNKGEQGTVENVIADGSQFNNLLSVLKKIQAAMERTLSPGFGTCGKCNRPWKFVDHHTTNYAFSVSTNDGMFPLCKQCWTELKTPKARLPYYRRLWMDWHKWGKPKAKWEDIENAVMDGR